MDLNSIADSTDWNPTRLPALAALESALRCQICKDFYDSPVITSCCHTFCSLCIRRCLTADQICPICRARDEEIRLRKNNAVQELLDSFVTIRQQLLDIVKQPGIDTSFKEKVELTGRRRIEDASTNGVSHNSRRSTRSSTRKSASARHTPAVQEVITLEDDDDNQNFDPIQDSKEVEVESGRQSPTNTKMDDQADDGLYECPICGKRIKPALINSHLDTCVLANQEDDDEYDPRHRKSKTLKSSSRSVVSSPSKRSHNNFSSQYHNPSPPLQPALQEPYTPEQQRELRLPKLNYSLLNESKLRTKLSELGVKSVGTKAILEKRHTEWVNIWNANLDAKAPKTKKQLLAELDQLEKEQLKPKVNPIKKDGFSDEKWTNKHRDDFDELIKNARSKRRKVVEEEDKEKKKDEQRNEEVENDKQEDDGVVVETVTESPFFINGVQHHEDIADHVMSDIPRTPPPVAHSQPDSESKQDLIIATAVHSDVPS